MSFKPALLTVSLAVLLGAGACGKDSPAPNVLDSPAPTLTGTPPPGSTATGQPSENSTPTSPAVGLPEGFPDQHEVPMVSGLVTRKDSGTQSNGLMGWQLELEAVGSQKDCFDRAAAALTAAGFTKQEEMTAGETRQAQFTTRKWAVIISSRADGDNCQLGYEVGQLSK